MDLMEYLPGIQLADCFDDLPYSQKRQTAEDLAEIMHSLFSITAPLAGCLLYDKNLEELLSLRFNDLPNHVAHTDNFPNQISPSSCGPFKSERSFLEAFAYCGMPAQRPASQEDQLGNTFDMILKVYDSIRPLYDFDTHRFHLAHGDFSSANILVDPSTGHITGLIDWEMAGFRPSWLAAVSPGWFNDDSCRFLVTDDQSDAEGYDQDTPEDAELRLYFQDQLRLGSSELYKNWFDGVELRAIFYNLCHEYAGNAEVWLEKYSEKQWPDERGDFPFDYWGWMKAKLGVE